PKAMPWSAPVLIRKDGKKLAVELPPQVAADLKAGPGDVLNFTKLPDGDIQKPDRGAPGVEGSARRQPAQAAAEKAAARFLPRGGGTRALRVRGQGVADRRAGWKGA